MGFQQTSSMNHRNDQNLLLVEPVNQPIAVNEDLPDVVVAKFGNHSAEVGKYAEIPR